MDTRLTPDQLSRADVVRKVLADRAPLRADGDSARAAATWGTLAGLGVAGVLVPESAGGSGLGPVDACAVAEELGACAARVPFEASGVHAVAVLQSVIGDTSALQSEIASGVVAVALDSVHQKPDAKGRFEGEWRNVAHGDAAAVVLVRTGAGLVRFDRSSGAIRSTAQPSIDPSRPVAEVLIAGRGELLGSVDESQFRRADELRALALVADGVGAARSALTDAREYALTREQFGKPIGSFQAVQHLCVDMYIAIELARLGVRGAAWLLAEGLPRASYATAAAAVSGAQLSRVSAMAIQVLGGIGYTWEHELHLLHKRLLSLRATLGTDPHRADTIVSFVAGT